ncbi:flagellar hook-associated protein FlgL [Ammoniphilus sp. CFH 90114]|uniref:flagellar hook-associated protein FlgL n=1 Tax=Ammoniphilus sp. CFH 90114 TaxID=2493665 RepID=UPI00100F10C2|nr:flagellar hook-associated protein FlgL [Ammoniphilus sp. CFH 90114]RXT04476.1 flagellar hook-associated protein FlgL [Ammoniphilus sp. CFH 90114]
MSFRVTQSILSNNMLRNINKSYKKLETLQEQMATNRQFSKPSDNPLGAMKSMQYRTQLFENAAFQKNASEALGWMEMTDGLISEAGDSLTRVKELLVQATNDTLGEKERKAIAKELGQIKEHMGTVANANINGRYLFSGTATDQPPYSPGSETAEPPFQDGRFNGDAINNDLMEVEISKGIYIPMNVPGKELFEHGEQGVFGVLDQIITDLSDPTKRGEELSVHMAAVDAQKEHFSKIQSSLGGRVNRLENASNRLEEQEVTMTAMLSENEDIDIAKVITQLTAQNALHNAALSTGAQVIQKTLVDFLG